MKNNITVVDSIMGSGKTSWAIQMMSEAPVIKGSYILLHSLQRLLG